MSNAHEVHQLAALVHGRYLLQPAASGGEGAPLLVGCHGYGENAAAHLAALSRIPGAAAWNLCAVAALSRFYNTKTGEVIGSWMTKEDRELAIGDNIRYVASVVEDARRRTGASDQLVFAGFSQGVAMAYRAAARCGFPCHGLIVLAADVPPEIAESEVRLPPVLLGRGTEDTWYTEEKMDQDVRVLIQKEVPLTSCIFEGGHEWGEDFLAAAGEMLERLSEA